MRPLPIILALSLAVNIGLALAWNNARSAANAKSVRTVTRLPKTAPAAKDTGFDPDILAGAFKNHNAAVLFAQLRALGLNDATASDITGRIVWLKYYNRRQQLLDAKTNNNADYWRGSTTTRNLTAAERKELRDLANQVRRELLETLGTADTGGLGAVSARYSFLAPEKVAQLLDLQRDYDEMRSELADGLSRFRVPSDIKQLQVLSAEQRKDLSALLSPEELAAYDQRFSSTASIIRRAAEGINLNESEYLAVYAIMSADRTGRDSADLLKEVLGDDRYEAFMRARSPDYQTLLAAADRFNIPAQTINNVFALRDVVSSESQRIAADTSLSSAEKRRALQGLSNTIRDQVRADLGEEVGNAYLQQSMTWLTRLASGYAITFTPTGGYQYNLVAPTTTRSTTTTGRTLNTPTTGLKKAKNAKRPSPSQ